MTVKVTKPAVNLREKLAELDKPMGVAGAALMRADTPQEQFNLIGAGRKNILINGDFQVSQRGDFTTATTTTGYLVDRWKVIRSGVGGNSTHYKNQTVNGELMNTIKHESTDAGTARVHIRQYVEAVGSKHQYAGKTLTYSAWVRSNSSNARILIYDYGVSTYIGTSVAHSGNGQWEKLTMTVTCGTGNVSVSGYGLEINASITGPTNGAIPVSSGDYIEIAQPQLELGSVATPFEHRSYGEELALCQRYYYKYAGAGKTNQIVAYGLYATTNLIDVNIKVPVPFRASPAVAVSGSPATFDAYSASDFSSVAVGAVDSLRAAVGTSVTVRFDATGIAADAHILFGNPDITFDAEL